MRADNALRQRQDLGVHPRGVLKVSQTEAAFAQRGGHRIGRAKFGVILALGRSLCLNRARHNTQLPVVEQYGD